MQTKVLLLTIVLATPAPLVGGEPLAGSEEFLVKQNRPLIYTSPGDDVARQIYKEPSINGRVIKSYSGLKKFFADLGLIYPFFQVRLELNDQQIGVPVEEVSWEFPKRYFFTGADNVPGKKVVVNVWRSFPVTAHVRFADGSEKKYRKWIEPEEFPRN